MISFCLIHHLWNLRLTLDGGLAILAGLDYLQSEVFNKGAHALISCNLYQDQNAFDNLSVNVNFISCILRNKTSNSILYFIWKFIIIHSSIFVTCQTSIFKKSVPHKCYPFYTQRKQNTLIPITEVFCWKYVCTLIIIITYEWGITFITFKILLYFWTKYLLRRLLFKMVELSCLLLLSCIKNITFEYIKIHETQARYGPSI